MRNSIRWRLQVWYALVLVSVVGGFAGILYYQTRSARMREVDAALESAAQYIDASLRRFPPHELEGGEPREHFLPPGGGPPQFRPPGPDGPRRGFPGRDGPRGGFREDDEPRPGSSRPDGLRRERPGANIPRLRPPGTDAPRLAPPSRERLLGELTPPMHAGPRGDDDPSETYFIVWRADGSILKASEFPGGVEAPDPVGLLRNPQPRLRRQGEYREVTMLGPMETGILVGKSIRREQAELRAFAWQLGGVSIVVLVIGMAGGWFVSSRILQPLASISATASAISATNLSERIDLQKVDRELAEMAGVLNAMFDRLEAAFERQVRFTADASHELRTPLAIVRSHAELALARPRAVEEYRDALQACLRASERMSALVEGLLTLARADAGKLDLAREPVDLRRLVEETVNLVRPLAEARGLHVELDLAAAHVLGDASRLAQVITNLVSNAVQYNRAGGAVGLHLVTTDGFAQLSVRDSGWGIQEADRPHIFERFYRVDKARSRSSGGHGLGLAICKTIVQAHRGTIGFQSEAERGSIFWLRLPCAP